MKEVFLGSNLIFFDKFLFWRIAFIYFFHREKQNYLYWGRIHWKVFKNQYKYYYFRFFISFFFSSFLKINCSTNEKKDILNFKGLADKIKRNNQHFEFKNKSEMTFVGHKLGEYNFDVGICVDFSFYPSIYWLFGWIPRFDPWVSL